jgi:hypothetical protein
VVVTAENGKEQLAIASQTHLPMSRLTALFVTAARHLYIGPMFLLCTVLTGFSLNVRGPEGGDEPRSLAAEQMLLSSVWGDKGVKLELTENVH